MTRLALALAFALSSFAVQADETCTAAAHRVLAFVLEEAKGTRHEAQIAETIRTKGEGKAVSEIAALIEGNQCDFLLIAPDSTVRALAITMLPERNGQ